MPENTVWWSGGDRFDGLAYHGSEAIIEMRRLLQPLSPCIELCERIAVFCGSDLVLSTYPDADSGSLLVYAGRQFPEKVHVRIGLRSDRFRESLVHELLHAELLRTGFPRLGEKHGDQLHWELLNHVQHEIMFPLYVELGLDPTLFLAPKEVLDTLAIEHALIQSNIGVSEISIQWSGDRQYLTLNGDAQHMAWAATAIERFERKYPGITERLHQLEAWYGRRDFANPSDFERVYGEACQLIGLQMLDPSAWFRMEAGDAKPVCHYGKAMDAC